MQLSYKLFNWPRFFIWASLLSLSALCFADAEPIQGASQNEALVIDQEIKGETPPPFLEEDSIKEISYWKEFFRMMMVLGIILGVVLVIAWFLKGFLNKRVQQVNESNIVKVIERRNLSQKSMLYLVEVYEKQYLIGDSASGGVEFLQECAYDPSKNPPKAAFESKGMKASFMDILQRKLKEKQLKPQKIKNDQTH